ncbi:uncharacterized protein LOC128201152 [Galleria mellonella]|uniref:Uncharacterized protein LOC128201073 n=1 Tax=Galleria mellonella TaxID=7137 RepID=A0ABM3MPD6_GALME|nr:uncharacterized protein LOC128201073 [Galleria mellonella]XP_052753100.1 uncharacterized protein LOC128201152 [Galleria mellonella]
MASKKISCAGCLNIIMGKLYLKCHTCRDIYDLSCANVSEKRFNNNMTKEHKQAWVCPACRNKQPKGDNTNTPIRQGNLGNLNKSSDSEDSQSSYVTQRKKQSTSLYSHSEDELRRLIKSEMRASLREELPDLIRPMLEKELYPLKERLQDLQNTVQYISNQYEDLNKTISTLSSDYNKMKCQCDNLESTVLSLTERINTIDQNLRDSNIEIQGVPESKTENPLSIIKKIAETVSYNLSDTDVLNCTRVASMNRNSKRPRAIIAKLRSTRCRDELYSAIARYNKSHPHNKLNSSNLGISGNIVPIYVSEHLSPFNKSVHAAARLKAKELAYRFVWVRNGHIFMRKNETSQFIHVKNLQVLENLQ